MTPLDVWASLTAKLDPAPPYAHGVPDADRTMGSWLAWAAALMILAIIAIIVVAFFT